jgi:hypothetical protein
MSADLDDLERDLAVADLCPSHRVARLTTFVSRASRVEDLEAAGRGTLEQRNVRVAEDHRVGLCERPAQALEPAFGGAGIMHDSDPNIPDRQLETVWQQRAHRGVVNISVYGSNVSERPQLLEDADGDEVAGVDDQVRFL